MTKLAQYLELKAQAKAIDAQLKEAATALKAELKIDGAYKKQHGDYEVINSSAKRWTFKKGKGKGLFGVIKRKFSEELAFKLMTFDHKDFVTLKEQVSAVGEFFEAKEFYQLRVKECKKTAA